MLGLCNLITCRDLIDLSFKPTFKFKSEKSNRILTLVLEAITLINKVIFYVMKATSASQKLHPNKKLAKPKGTNVRVNQ